MPWGKLAIYCKYRMESYLEAALLKAHELSSVCLHHVSSLHVLVVSPCVSLLNAQDTE